VLHNYVREREGYNFLPRSLLVQRNKRVSVVNGRLRFVIILRVILRTALEEVDGSKVKCKQAPEPIPYTFMS